MATHMIAGWMCNGRTLLWVGMGWVGVVAELVLREGWETREWMVRKEC